MSERRGVWLLESVERFKDREPCVALANCSITAACGINALVYLSATPPKNPLSSESIIVFLHEQVPYILHRLSTQEIHYMKYLLFPVKHNLSHILFWSVIKSETTIRMDRWQVALRLREKGVICGGCGYMVNSAVLVQHCEC